MPLSRFLAGLTRSGSGETDMPVAVGVAGRFMMRVRGSENAAAVPVAIAFLEWSDCRWWHWQLLLGTDGKPMPDGDMHRSADNGDPLPQGLGRWWSLGRRTGVRVQVGWPSGGVQPSESPLVH